MDKKEKEYWKNEWLNRPEERKNSFAVRAFSLIKNKKFKKILDLGCGDGRDSKYFAQKGFDVMCVDFSKTGIDKVKQYNIKNIKAVKKNIQDISFSKNYFDVVYAHLSLHYFDDKTTNKIINKIYNILKPGGYFFIKCKSVEDSLYGVGDKVGENMYRKSHLRHFFTKEYMKEKLHKFKIIKIRKTSSTYNVYKSSFIEAVAKK